MLGTTVLGRYRVDAEIGKGAMGTVYRGTNTKLDVPVAIKVMHDKLGGQAQMRKRFQREARAAAKLQHPNLIGVLDAGETADGRPVMVLELAKGETLTSILSISPAPRRVVRLVEQLLLGLDHAHEAGLIHRDLKPDNIIVEIGPDGTEIPRIVDFGIALLREKDGSIAGGKLTETGQVIGTPLYMAPEQAQAEPYDHRVDLFALGVITYQMLAGTPPFKGSSIEISLAYITKDPPPIKRFVADVDPLLEAFALRLMARQLEQRFATARDALHALNLIDSDRRAAGLALGIMDASSAAAAIALPEAPPHRRR